MRVLIAALLCGGALIAATESPQRKPVESWPVWGGPRRNFIAPSTGLADAWPPAGPPRLWTRALGDGYSAIAEEQGVLFTAYRRGSKDVVVALDAATGKTICICTCRAATPGRRS